MKTGFKNLDEVIEIKKGELIVIASRPAMGKTTFALNISNYISLKEKKGVLFFSLENSKKSIEEKLIISNSMVEKEKLEKNSLLDADRNRIEYGEKLLKNAPIYIESDAQFSINDICLKSRKIKEEKDIEVIIIDYLQLIQFDKKKLLSRDDEITEILRKLKVLAKELDVPVIITSQLSRNCENRDDKRPMIADFTDSKYGINTYSNKILFLYRDSYYNKENKSNITEIIVAKNNGGKISNVKIAWLPEYCKFGNVVVLDNEKGDKNAK